MIPQLEALGMGAKILSPQEAADIDLGPLALLKGTWVGKPFQGWNVISVPGRGADGFVLEVIPYQETLTFSPAIVAAENRGPVINNMERIQDIVGLMYEQTITSVCTSDFCRQRGFGAGNKIHAETGMILNLKNFESKFDVVRMSTIPHGNALLAPGQSATGAPDNNNFIDKAPTLPTNLNGSPILDYGLDQFTKTQFPTFNQENPNTFLTATLGGQKIDAMTTLTFSTDNEDGGILNIPFLQNNVKATRVTATFWIETIKNPIAGKADTLQLQYSQTISLVFPPTGSNVPVIWPHVTVNTLTKQ